jgi:hypothetical protein
LLRPILLHPTLDAACSSGSLIAALPVSTPSSSYAPAPRRRQCAIQKASRLHFQGCPGPDLSRRWADSGHHHGHHSDNLPPVRQFFPRYCVFNSPRHCVLSGGLLRVLLEWISHSKANGILGVSGNGKGGRVPKSRTPPAFRPRPLLHGIENRPARYHGWPHSAVERLKRGSRPSRVFGCRGTHASGCVGGSCVLSLLGRHISLPSIWYRVWYLHCNVVSQEKSPRRFAWRWWGWRHISLPL